jgi:hypothetical protein
MEVSVVSSYDKEAVEHLVDQLIKLQNTYTSTYIQNSYADKSQIMDAMKKINAGLGVALTTRRMTLE